MIDPVTRWIISACAGLALLCVVGLYGYHKGKDRVQDSWDASVQRGLAEVERLKSEAGRITEVEVIKYVDRIKEVRVKGDTIVKRVPVYVSRDLPELPGAFRLLHDAAAGQTPLPDSPDAADGSPVAPQDVAATVADNYLTCHENAARLTALQSWVDEQHRLNPGE